MSELDEIFILNDDQPTKPKTPDTLDVNLPPVQPATSLPTPIAKVRLQPAVDDIEHLVARGYPLPDGLYQSNDVLAANFKPAPPDPFTLLARIPNWAYRCYTVVPVQTESGAFQPNLYLFNVIVALEWNPDAVFLERLRWAFQQASDFLFDATDGWMAFGQVIFGGVELMGCADIQIMASNRLHPRSWVGGMFEKEQHRPIRIGRGVWSDRQEVAFTWEEPEAYRILVHEWGHYALYLGDEYLSPPKTISDGIAAAFTVIIPQIVAGTESIMANTEGISELSSGAWRKLRAKHYRKIPSNRRQRVGPQRVPGALPRFFLQKNWYEQYSQAPDVPQVVIPRQASAEAEQLITQFQKPMQFRHCWLYVLPDLTEQQAPTRILAQGSLDARSKDQDYLLLGAKPDDTVVLISAPPNENPLILHGTVNSDRHITNWQPYESSALPIVAVVPAPTVDQQGRSQVYIRVRFADHTQPTQVAIYPLGQASNQAGIVLEDAGRVDGADWMSKPVTLPTLDGHVFVRTQGGLAITTFSQGGDPPFHNPAPANPINAGSADGNAMLFFYKPEGSEPDQLYDTVKVVTTRVAGVPYMATLRSQTRILSAAYSLASNAALPSELHPTLILYYNLPEELLNLASLMQGDIAVYRLDGATWQKQPHVFVPITRGSLFVAMPLYSQSEQHPGGSLVQDEAETPGQRIESYVVCWSPHSA